MESCVVMVARNLNFLIIIPLSALFLSSCLPERKIANALIQSPPNIDLVVYAPGMVFKYNHKGEEIEGFDSLSEEQQDSALWVQSRYIQYLSDSTILENYVNSFITELRQLGFNVYLDNPSDSTLAGKPQSYVWNISQIQLDEYNYMLEDEEPFEDTIYYKRVDLNAVDFSCWFELNKINTEKAHKITLYTSATAYDDFEGEFYYDPWLMNMKYKYRIDTMQVKDVINIAAYLGRKHAGYLYDYFLNQVISARMPENEMIYYYYHYNRFSKTVAPTDDEGFEILKSE